jgi:pimeloyl-ACP methyl ester carboxylesterase
MTRPCRRAAAATTTLLIAMMVAVAIGSPRAATAASIYCSSKSETRQVVELVHGFTSDPGAWNQEDRDYLTSHVQGICLDVFDYTKWDVNWVTDTHIGPALAGRIDTLGGASKAGGGSGKVIVIGHSMGGLATRCAAVASCNGGRTDVAGHLAELITFGTPTLGSYLASPATHGVGSILSASCYAAVVPTALRLLCPAIREFTTSGAARAFVPGSADLRSLPQMPVTIPVYRLAAHVEAFSSFFGLNNTDLGSIGDVVVLEDSASAQPRKIGAVGGEQVIGCGTIDLTDLLRIHYSCWHSTETHDTRFLQAAVHQIGLIEAANTPATTTAKITPVTTDGTPLPGWSVTALDDPVECATGGTAYPSSESLDDNVYSCSPSAASADVCWPAADPALVYCLIDPFGNTLTSHPADGPLPPVSKETKYVTPVGLYLSNGLQCRARNGGSWSSPVSHPGWAGWFSCGRGDPYTNPSTDNIVVWAGPGSTSGIDESGKTWTVYIGADDGSDPITKANVTKALFVGYQ